MVHGGWTIHAHRSAMGYLESCGVPERSSPVAGRRFRRCGDEVGDTQPMPACKGPPALLYAEVLARIRIAIAPIRHGRLLQLRQEHDSATAWDLCARACLCGS